MKYINVVETGGFDATDFKTETDSRCCLLWSAISIREQGTNVHVQWKNVVSSAVIYINIEYRQYIFDLRVLTRYCTLSRIYRLKDKQETRLFGRENVANDYIAMLRFSASVLDRSGYIYICSANWKIMADTKQRGQSLGSRTVCISVEQKSNLTQKSNQTFQPIWYNSLQMSHGDLRWSWTILPSGFSNCKCYGLVQVYSTGWDIYSANW